MYLCDGFWLLAFCLSIFILQWVLFVKVQMINHYFYMCTGHIYVIIRALIFVDGKAILTSYIILFMCLVL